MWKTVIRSLVALMILLAAGRASAAPGLRKLFIREIALKGSCVSEVSTDSLRALIAQEVPRDLLERRGLAYEDPTPYLDAGTWNAENFNARESRHIMQRLRQLDMQLMMWLEVSCVPGRPGEPTFVLTGRLLDLDQMDRILSCQDAQVRDQRRICHVSGDVYEAVTFARVELHSFAEFVEKLRTLLARLLHIPEIIFHPSPTTFAPGQKISLQFSVRPNNTARGVPSGAAVHALQRRFRYIQRVVRVPDDQRGAVCQDPEQHWKPCGGDERGACLDVVPFQSRADGTIISFRAPSHEDDFLVRAEVVTVEEGGEVRSVPVYRCLSVHERTWRLGATVRVGFSLPYDRWGGLLSGTLLHSQGDPHIGVDLSLERTVIRPRSYLPLIGLAAILGGTYIGRNAEVFTPDLIDKWKFNRSYAFGSSWTTEVRGQLYFDVLHWWQGFLRLYVDAGLGFEWINTNGEVGSGGAPSPGAHVQVLGGVGLSLGRHFGLAPSWDLGLTLGIFYQVRGRVSNQQGNLGELLDPLMHPLWITLGFDLASPLR